MNSEAPATSNTPNASNGAMRNAIIVGTVIQLIMVVSGHWVLFIKMNLFAAGGVIISALVGAMYARDAQTSRGKSAAGGAIAGGVCALIGIVVSYAMGDVPAFILIVGTCSSAIGGAVGGAISAPRRS